MGINQINQDGDGKSMTKSILSVLLISTIFTTTYCSGKYSGSPTACVTLAGAIVKAQHADISKKYKRSECPVCKGKGWYISGDKIAKVDCGYCEPEKTHQPEKKGLIQSVR